MLLIFIQHYEFQDLESGWMIDNARERVGLYLLKVPNNPEKKEKKKKLKLHVVLLFLFLFML